MAFRSKPGFTSSLPRMFMLGTTTLMFAMGIAALVLVTIAELSNMRTFLSNGELPFSIVVCYYAWAGIACLMVRTALTQYFHLLGSINVCSVYSMRCHLCLAHGGYLEQRQAHNCHSCDLRPWDLRYVKGISQKGHHILIWNHRS